MPNAASLPFGSVLAPRCQRWPMMWNSTLTCGSSAKRATRTVAGRGTIGEEFAQEKAQGLPLPAHG